MIRIFPPDVLHTLFKGVVEYCLGFILQILDVLSEIDVDFAESAKKVCESIRTFPGYNSFHPVRHVSIDNIFDFYQSAKSKNRRNSIYNVTGVLKMRETYKSASALLQIMFSILDITIFPRGYDWCISQGFEAPYFCVQQTVVNALNNIFEIVWYMNADSLTERQLQCMEMLIANAQVHMLLLDLVRKRLLRKSQSKKDSFVDVDVNAIGKLGTPKFHMLYHYPDSIRASGCDNNARDTSRGESDMKGIKLLYTQISKRNDSASNEMLVKYQHLHYLSLMKKGLDLRETNAKIVNDSKRSMIGFQVVHSQNLSFEINRSYKNQALTWSPLSSCYVLKVRNEMLLVHPLLVQVS